ncbi:MAG: 3',5'-cyclic-nucleotide phosphodiesterase, partial [Gammaproteobacteria bacterium]
ELELSRMAYHYCPQLLAADLAKLRHRPQLYLSHLKPGMEAQILSECAEMIEGFPLRLLSGGCRFQL